MSEIKVGDRVIDRFAWQHAGKEGTVTEVRGENRIYVKLDDAPFEYGIYRRDELELVEPQFVNVTTSRSIWVTLPGDNAGHRLTEDEARALFRQLEEVV